MEVVISKVEELKVLIDSATDRVKGSSVHCLQELLHHLVTFYSTHRFVFFSLVVVDTKTGKEQRFYTFRDLLDHSKHLLSQTEQGKSSQNCQYLERVLGNRANTNNSSYQSSNQSSSQPGSQPESRRNITESSLQSPENPVNHGKQLVYSVDSYPRSESQRSVVSQQQHFSAFCAQPRNGFLNATHLTTERTETMLPNSDHHSPPSALQQNPRVARDAYLQKDNPDRVVYRLPTGPDNGISNVAMTASNSSYVNYQYNNSSIGAANLHSLNDGHHASANRDHRLPVQSNTQSFTDCQPRSTTSQHVLAGHGAAHQMHYSISSVQSLGHAMNNLLPERRNDEIVLSPELNSFNIALCGTNNTSRGDFVQSNVRPIPSFSAAAMEPRSIFPGIKSHAESAAAASSLRGLIDSDTDSCEPSDWSSMTKSQQMQKKKPDYSPDISPLVDLPRHSFSATVHLTDKSLDLTGATKSTSDLTKVPEVVARRSLSRMTNTPMIPIIQPLLDNQDQEETVNSPVHMVYWSSCRKEGSNLWQNAVQMDHDSNITQPSTTADRVIGSQIDKEQALNALLARKLSEDTRHLDQSRAATATADEYPSRRHSVNSTLQDKHSKRSKHLNKSIINRAIVPRRKSNSPQECLLVCDVAQEDLPQKRVRPNETNSPSSKDRVDDDNDSCIEIVITSDSANEECLDHESSHDSGKLGKPKKGKSNEASNSKYYCFYCNNSEHKVTFKDLLHHLKEKHLKLSHDKTGLPCPRCGKLFTHKTRGTDSLYSTVLACLNHMMCQHSSVVPNYMKVHKCGQCTFISLIKSIVKRHEQCHTSQDNNSQLKDNRKQMTKKLSQNSKHTNNSPINDGSQSAHQGGELSCEFCMKGYSSKSALAIHIKRKHKSINSFLCSMCPSSFYAKVDLERHMYAQHAVNISKRAVIKCPNCDYQSLEGSLMRKHIKNHQTGSFICNICSKEFGTENRLKSHRLIHTAERKYKCDHCDYATAKRYHFERHVAVRHKGQFWKCSSCSMLTFNKNNVQKHINKVHQGNGEVEEMKNAKESKGEKKNKNQKKKVNMRAVGSLVEKTVPSNNSNNDNHTPANSSIQLFSTALDVNTDVAPDGSAIVNFQERSQADSDKLIQPWEWC